MVGFAPFAQQSVNSNRYYGKPSASQSFAKYATSYNVTNSTSSSFQISNDSPTPSNNISTVPISIQYAVDTALTNSAHKFPDPLVICLDSKCTWEQYTSLAFCAKTENITAMVYQEGECGSEQGCWFGVQEMDDLYKASPRHNDSGQPTIFAYGEPRFGTMASGEAENVAIYTANMILANAVNHSISVMSPQGIEIVRTFVLHTDNITTSKSFTKDQVSATRTSITFCLQDLRTESLNGSTTTSTTGDPIDATWHQISDPNAAGIFWAVDKGINYTINDTDIYTLATYLSTSVLVNEGRVLNGIVLDHEEPQTSPALLKVANAVQENSTLHDPTFIPGTLPHGFRSVMNDIAWSMSDMYAIQVHKIMLSAQADYD